MPEPERASNNHPNVSRFTAAIARVIRPLVRLMVGNMTYPAFISIVQHIYVEEAERKLQSDPDTKRITKSSLALLTGIDTRKITQVMAIGVQHELQAPDLLPEASVLGQWANERTYRSQETDLPIDLPVYGRGLTFQNLVTRTVGRNVTAQTVLDRLVNIGNIEYIDENTVRLLSPFFFPLTGAKYEMLDVGMLAVSNLLQTVEHNITYRNDIEDRFVQQQRWSRAIPADKQDEFREHMAKFIHEQIDQSVDEIVPFEAPVRNNNSITAGIGIYYFESQSEYEETPTPLKPDEYSS